MFKIKNFKKLLSIALACVMPIMCMGEYCSDAKILKAKANVYDIIEYSHSDKVEVD